MLRTKFSAYVPATAAILFLNEVSLEVSNCAILYGKSREMTTTNGVGRVALSMTWKDALILDVSGASTVLALLAECAYVDSWYK